jgi:2',3'-cyclic-nucleotide 2'-phosphodiesterase (5'-nucleotidase family)
MATQLAICKYVKQWIDDYRSDLYLAVELDRFTAMIDGYLDTVGEAVKITKEDVKTCLKYDDTVKIMDVDGKEVLWLWDGWRLYSFIDKVANLASKYGEVWVDAPYQTTSDVGQ